MVFVVPIVYSEIFIFGNSELVKEDKQFIQHVFVEYPILERERSLFSLPIIDMELSIACEDITEFNNNNPDNVIENVSFNFKKRQIRPTTVEQLTFLTNTTFEEDEFDLISEIDVGGNPIITFFKKLFGIDVETRIIAFARKQRFTFIESEYMFMNLVTTFQNESGTIDDSICTFDVGFDSINCEDCGRLSFEEASKKIDIKKETFITVLGIYNLISTFVDLNFDLWTFLSWFIKIAVMLGSIFFLVYSVFWLYFFLRRTFGKKNERELI